MKKIILSSMIFCELITMSTALAAQSDSLCYMRAKANMTQVGCQFACSQWQNRMSLPGCTFSASEKTQLTAFCKTYYKKSIYQCS